LAALVAGYKLFGSDKQNFSLAALQEQPKLLFELTMFDRIFQIFDTVGEASRPMPAQHKPLLGRAPAFVSQPAI
jgi:anti-anti-sigma regulatory factor